MKSENRRCPKPLIGILCWEEGVSPRGLVQLESLKGNSTNPDTFAFPVKYVRVKGANIHTILEKPCRNTLQRMIKAARAMENEGICAITTSCGFNAVFQRELADSVAIPLFTSSLMQIPLVQAMLGSDQKIGVLTAKKSALTDHHFINAGITNLQTLHIQGLETCPEWNKIFTSPHDDIDMEIVENEIISTACTMMQSGDIGAFVLECTDLPPFAHKIRQKTGKPVFDFVTLVQYIYSSVTDTRPMG